MYNRILVTGNSGSGKTTLGKALGKKLGIETYGLDRIVWQPGWQKTPEAEKTKKIKEITQKKRWIIEGVSMVAFEAAEVVIFLDRPLYQCYGRALKRSWKHLFSQRPELPPNCPEWQIIPRQIKLMWKFQTTYRPMLLEAIAQAREIKKILHHR